MLKIQIFTLDIYHTLSNLNSWPTYCNMRDCLRMALSKLQSKSNIQILFSSPFPSIGLQNLKHWNKGSKWKPLQLENQPRFHCHLVTHAQEQESPLPSRWSMPDIHWRNMLWLVSKMESASPDFIFTFAKLAWPGVILPFSYNLQSRQPTRVIAWILPSISTSFCWLIWKAAKGAPNCFLSFRYLQPLKIRMQHTEGWRQNSGDQIKRTAYILFITLIPVTHIIGSHWNAYRLPGNHDTWNSKHLFPMVVFR